MRDALVCLLLLSLGASNALANKRRRLLRKSRVWRKMRKNNVAIKRLTHTIEETQQTQQEFGSALDTLKENVDDMKKDFVSMTMMKMTHTKTSKNGTKDTGQVTF